MDTAESGKQNNREAILPAGSILIKAFLAVLFSLFLPFCLSGRFSEDAVGFVAVVIAMLGIADLFTGSSSPKYPILCLALGIIFSFLSQSIIIGACIASVLMTISDGTVALAFAGRRLRIILIAAIPAASFSAAFLLTENPLSAFTSVVFIPAAAVLALSVVKKAARVPAICAVSASIVIPVIILSVLTYVSAFGGLTSDGIRDFILGFRESTVKSFIDSYDSLAQTYYETYGTSAAALLGDGLSTEYVDNLVATLINLAPALIITAANAVGFLTQGLAVSRLRRMNAKDLLTPESAEFELSIFAPIVLLLSFAVAYFTSDGTDGGKLAAFISAENIFSVMEPAMALFGLKRLFRPKVKFPMFIPFIALLLALLFASSYFIKICAFWGAFARIYEAARINKPTSEGEK